MQTVTQRKTVAKFVAACNAQHIGNMAVPAATKNRFTLYRKSKETGRVLEKGNYATMDYINGVIHRAKKRHDFMVDTVFEIYDNSMRCKIATVK